MHHEATELKGKIKEILAAAERFPGPKISKVFLKVGYLRGLSPEALEFSFRELARGTALAGAELVVEEVPPEAVCSACRRPVALKEEMALACPECGSPELEITAGEEFQLDRLE